MKAYNNFQNESIYPDYELAKVPNGQRKERIKLMQEQLHKLHEILFPDYTSIWVRCGDFIKLHDNFGEHYNSIYSKTENEPSTK
ncbi:unnamed protein product [Rhizophagus irregularis]|uniref:Uncharacterized protein n=1 Tax=Rhizophagus irregularis TaxID=588596 RepID=A0A915ZGY0_9GLOM|nr:unnamed protein product [Rhizophagus irregularis]CAB5373907.1 unnamed protein product [Rhizophagus irregularis]